jgi:hypothetical protein
VKKLCCSGPGSMPDQVMCDLRWTKWHWGRVSPSSLFSPAKSHSTNCSWTLVSMLTASLNNQLRRYFSLLWKSNKVHYRVHYSPSPSLRACPKLNQSIHSSPSYLFKIQINIILLSTARSFKWSLPLKFLKLKFSIHFSHLSHACWIPCQSCPWFDHSNI